MANDERCQFQVSEPPWYLHKHTCGRRVKYAITTKEGTERGVCGIHKRKHERRAGMPLGDHHFKKEV